MHSILCADCFTAVEVYRNRVYTKKDFLQLFSPYITSDREIARLADQCVALRVICVILSFSIDPTLKMLPGRRTKLIPVPGREEWKKFVFGTKERAKMRLTRAQHSFSVVRPLQMRSYRSVPLYRGLSWIGRNRSSYVYIKERTGHTSFICAM